MHSLFKVTVLLLNSRDSNETSQYNYNGNPGVDKQYIEKHFFIIITHINKTTKKTD